SWTAPRGPSSGCAAPPRAQPLSLPREKSSRMRHAALRVIRMRRAPLRTFIIQRSRLGMNPRRDEDGNAPLRAPNARGLALALLLLAAVGCQSRATPAGGGTAGPGSSPRVDGARAMPAAGGA